MSSLPPPTTSSASYGVATNLSDVTRRTSTVSKNGSDSQPRWSWEAGDDPGSRPSSFAVALLRTKAKRMARKAKELFSRSHHPAVSKTPQPLSQSSSMPLGTERGACPSQEEQVEKQTEREEQVKRQKAREKKVKRQQEAVNRALRQLEAQQARLTVPNFSRPLCPPRETMQRTKLANIMEEDDEQSQQINQTKDEGESDEDSMYEGVTQHPQSLQQTTMRPIVPRASPMLSQLQVQTSPVRLQTTVAALPPPPPIPVNSCPRPLPRPPSPTGV